MLMQRKLLQHPHPPCETSERRKTIASSLSRWIEYHETEQPSGIGPSEIITQLAELATPLEQLRELANNPDAPDKKDRLVDLAVLRIRGRLTMNPPTYEGFRSKDTAACRDVCFLKSSDWQLL